MQILIKITKFGISFNSDGTTTFFAQLEKTSASQKEYLEKIQEKKAAEKKEAKKKEQLKQIEVKKATVQANSKDELWIKLKILNGILSNQRIIKSVGDLIFQFSIFRWG